MILNLLMVHYCFIIQKPLDFFHYNLPTHFNIKGYDFMADQISKNLK